MLRPYQIIKRRKSRVINVGNVKIGGNNPIAVQTMTNTLTSNSNDTISQIERCAKLGVDIVRVSIPDEDSSQSLKEIVKHSPVPIIADIHFHYKEQLKQLLMERMYKNNPVTLEILIGKRSYKGSKRL